MSTRAFAPRGSTIRIPLQLQSDASLKRLLATFEGASAYIEVDLSGTEKSRFFGKGSLVRTEILEVTIPPNLAPGALAFWFSAEDMQGRISAQAFFPVTVVSDSFSSNRLLGRVDTGDQFKGTARDVSINGSVAYVADDVGISVVDISSSDSPTILSRSEVRAPVVLNLSSDTLYSAGLFGLQLFDVTSPAEPTRLSMIELNEASGGAPFVNSIFVRGTSVFMTSAGRGLLVVDAADARRPVLLSSTPVDGQPSTVSVVGNRAYLTASDRNTGLMIFDVSDPAAPRFRGKAALKTSGLSAAISGQTAFVGTTQGLEVFDVSDSKDPVRIASLQTLGLYDLEKSGSTLWGTTSEGLISIDVSVPIAPTINGILEMPAAGRFQLSTSKAYISSGVGLNVIDISTPGSPRILGSIDATSLSTSVALLGDQALVCSGSVENGLQVFDISRPKSPRFTKSVAFDEVISKVDVANSSVVLQLSNKGIRLQNKDDLEATLGVIDTPLTSPMDFVMPDGDTLVILTLTPPGNSRPNLLVADISNPSAPAILGGMRLDLSTQQPKSLAVSGGSIAVLDFGGTLQFVDISNRQFPRTVGLLPLSGEPSLAPAESIRAEGQTVYLAGNGYLLTVDASDPTEPRIVNQLSLLDFQRLLEVRNGIAYLVTSNGDIRTFDVSSTEQPKPAGIVLTDKAGLAFPGDLTISAGTAYVASGYVPLQIYDVRLPVE